MKAKKSSLFFMPLVAFMTILVLTSLFIVLISKDKAIVDFPIGKRQFDLLKAFSKAESTLLYIDQSAKYSLEQSAYDLGKSGGISELDYSSIDLADASDDSGITENKDCGRIKGANVWYRIKKNSDSGSGYVSCFDENSVNYSMEYLFDNNLDEYLRAYPGDIPLNNYNYDTTGNTEIKGTAEKPLKVDITINGLSSEFETPKGTIAPVQVASGQPSCLRKAVSVSKVTGKAAADIPQTPAEVPKEEVQVSKQCIPNNLQGAISIGQDLIDFTSTGLCSKGETCILKIEAFQMLQIAESVAEQSGHNLIVYSSFRDPEKQKALWEGKTPERYDKLPVKERQKLVCNPNLGVEGCPHLSGDAIDMRFKKKEWKMSNKEWKDLSLIMKKSGWVPYIKNGRVVEPWHFECCGTKRYLAYTKDSSGKSSG